MVSIVVDFLFLFARCHSGMFVIGIIIDVRLFIMFSWCQPLVLSSFFCTNKRE